MSDNSSSDECHTFHMLVGDVRHKEIRLCFTHGGA
jgi:hypothetical protein